MEGSFFIGDVKIPNPLVLAPMAGITDTVFRKIIKQMGAGLVFTEMISCQALHYKNAKTLGIAEFDREEAPIAAQVFGSDAAMMGEGAAMLEAMGYSIIDVNLGCSVPKVARSGGGAALCRDIPRLARVIEAVVRAVKIPVTIKLRKGWSGQEESAFQVCRVARESGAAAVTIHGRTSVQRYTGKADWEFVKRLRESLDIPVMGSGDVKTPGDVARLLEYSGCAGIMIGREALCNPWIFRDALCLLKGRPVPPRPPFQEVMEMILLHLRGLVERFGDQPGTEKMRKFAAWYIRGLPGSSRFREAVFQMKTGADMEGALREYFDWVSRRKRDCPPDATGPGEAPQ
jgi:nifR3 family TIM-barrel protein